MKKQRWEESEKRRAEERRSEKRKSEKKEDAGARKGRKVTIHCVFPMICGSGGSKSRLAKAAGAEPCGQMRDEKVHAVVTRSTFPSQNAQNTPCSDHFWTLWCRKSAPRWGAKHISKSKCTKHLSFGARFEVDMSKKCMPLWRGANFEVKMWKAPDVRTTFGSWDVVLRGWCKGLCTLSKVSKTWRFCSISNNDGRRGTLEEDLAGEMFRIEWTAGWADRKLYRWIDRKTNGKTDRQIDKEMVRYRKRKIERKIDRQIDT